MSNPLELSVSEFSGCYMLMWRSAVVYIGQSRNMPLRVSQHYYRQRRHLQGKPTGGKPTGKADIIYRFDTVRMYPCPINQLDVIERKLMIEYNPLYNVNLKRTYTPKIDIDALIARTFPRKDLSDWRTSVEQRHSVPVHSFRRM